MKVCTHPSLWSINWVLGMQSNSSVNIQKTKYLTEITMWEVGNRNHLSQVQSNPLHLCRHCSELDWGGGGHSRVSGIQNWTVRGNTALSAWIWCQRRSWSSLRAIMWLTQESQGIRSSQDGFVKDWSYLTNLSPQWQVTHFVVQETRSIILQHSLAQIGFIKTNKRFY